MLDNTLDIIRHEGESANNRELQNQTPLNTHIDNFDR